MEKLAEILRQTLTEADNQTWCPLRVFGLPFVILGSTLFFVLSAWTVIRLRQPLDYVGFGAGLASVWGVYAAGIVGKHISDRRNGAERH